MVGRSCLLVMCCVMCASCGYIIMDPVDTRNDIQDESVDIKNQIGKATKMHLDHRRVNEKVESGRDSKDMLYPILVGVAAKVASTVPLVLTALALGAGYSLAASKAALLLGAVLLFYHYLSEGGFVGSLPKHWKHLPDWSGLWGHQVYHPQLTGYHHHGLGYHRDRNDRRWDVAPATTDD